jgi:trehalose/maltose hydrolase-like predicted phosphorylase
MSDGSEWVVGFDGYDPEDEQVREALLALGNGRMVTRSASLDARTDEHHYPGTYVAGFYNRLKGVIDEIGPVETEELVRLPNWLPLNFRIKDGTWFALDEVEIEGYRHEVDLKAGIGRREVAFRDGEGRRSRLVERRLVSMERPQLMAVSVELTALDWSGRVEVRAGLDGNVCNNLIDRFAPYPDRHLDQPTCYPVAGGVLLKTKTGSFGAGVALAQRVAVEGEGDEQAEVGDWTISQHFTREVAQDRPLRVEKVVALTTSRDLATGEAGDAASRLIARAPAFAGLERGHRTAWARLWARLGLEVEEKELARPLHFHAFHILQTLSPHFPDLDTGIPARGWHGEAYRGHIFWDELFSLPFLIPRFPEIARAHLLYRFRRLDEARAAAKEAGFRGAMYPWRSASDGREVTPRHQLNMLTQGWSKDYTYLQRHIGSIIAFNIWQYYQATADRDFLVDHGGEMMLEIARFWASRVEHDAKADRYDIRGVVGPDEYHTKYPGADRPGLDNNAFTNVTAAWTMGCTLEMFEHLPKRAQQALTEKLDLKPEEFELWEKIGRRMRVPFHGDRIISQFEGYETLKEFDPEILPEDLRDKRLDWALEAAGESVDAYQISKQADVLTMFHMFPVEEMLSLLGRLGYEFDREALKRTSDYYLERTEHRSSLSRIVYAGALAQVEAEKSWELFEEALGTDLHTLKGEDSAEGLHLGAMGGTFDVLQRRFLGIAFREGGIRLEPALPKKLGRVRFMLEVGGCLVEVESRDTQIRIRSEPDNERALTVEAGERRERIEPGEERVFDFPPPDGEA